MRCSLTQEDITKEQDISKCIFFGSLSPFFVMKNYVVSLVTWQNGTCQHLATKTKDF